MAKKSEIIGEYILTINDDNSVNVSMIPDNTKDELRKIAEKNNIAYDDKLTTHQLGALILKELGKPGENTLIFGEYEIEKEPGGRINLLKSYGNTKEGLRQISEQIGFEYNKEWNTQQFGRNLMNFIVKRDEEVATTPGNFVVNTTTTVGDLNKQFQSTYGGYLKIYNGRSVAKEDEKLVDIGAKTGEFSCRASRTVGSFVEAMKETFGLKVKVWTSDEWVTVLDGITLSKVRDLPKQATKAVLEAYESYKRENKEEQEQAKKEIKVDTDKPAKVESNFPTYEECLEKYPAHLPADAYELSEDGKIMSNITEAIDGPLVIPDGVEVVDFGHQYRNDELTAFILPDSVKEMKGSFNGNFCEKLEFVRLSPNMSLPESAFYYCPLESIQIPNGMKVIPKAAFEGTKLKELILPESVEYIMKDAFRGLKKIEEIVIPNNVKIIMPGAFSHCENLKKATILSPDTIIFPEAFKYCEQLGEEIEKELYEKHKVGDREIGADEVVYAEEEKSICGKTVRSKVLKYVPEYFCGELIIEEGTNKADYKGANLRDIEGITKLYIPDSMVEDIPSLPRHVEEVRFPESMEGLKEFERILYIESDSFVSFNFPKGLKKLKIWYAQLAELIVPESVNEVDLGHMPNLKKLVLPSSLEELSLSKLPLLEDLTIPEGVKELGYMFGDGCDNLKNVTLPDTLETIGENAFYGCENLTSIIIPSSVTEIESGAFSQCPNLTEVIMEGEPKIHPEAFEDTPGYEVKTTGLATMDWDEDGLPVVKINLVATQVSSYDEAYEEWDDWGSKGVLMVSNSRDIDRYPFDKISYIDASDEVASTKIEDFHSEFEDDCENALYGGYVLFQDTDDEFPYKIWDNTVRALNVIFNPEHSSVEFKYDDYEGPEAIFEFKVYNFGDYDCGLNEDAEPFHEARYRVFKNDADEWTSEKLD